MLSAATVAEVEAYIAAYGARQYWRVKDGKFEGVGPETIGIDPVSRTLVEIPAHSDGASVAIIVRMRTEILGHATSTFCRYMVETAVLF